MCVRLGSRLHARRLNFKSLFQIDQGAPQVALLPVVASQIVEGHRQALLVVLGQSLTFVQKR